MAHYEKHHDIVMNSNGMSRRSIHFLSTRGKNVYQACCVASFKPGARRGGVQLQQNTCFVEATRAV